jgi:hypothetical protein
MPSFFRDSLSDNNPFAQDDPLIFLAFVVLNETAFTLLLYIGSK